MVLGEISLGWIVSATADPDSGQRPRPYCCLPDFVPELIRRCRKEDLLFLLLDFLVGSVDNISAMDQAARDASAWGQPDPTLDDTVNGTLKIHETGGNYFGVAP